MTGCVVRISNGLGIETIKLERAFIAELGRDVVQVKDPAGELLYLVSSDRFIDLKPLEAPNG